jgi:hypothetical protein
MAGPSNPQHLNVAGDFAMLGEWCIQRLFMTSRARHAGPSPPCYRGVHHDDVGRRPGADHPRRRPGLPVIGDPPAPQRL